jgi:hypothetical protein
MLGVLLHGRALTAYLYAPALQLHSLGGYPHMCRCQGLWLCTAAGTVTAASAKDPNSTSLLPQFPAILLFVMSAVGTAGLLLALELVGERLTAW